MMNTLVLLSVVASAFAAPLIRNGMPLEDRIAKARQGITGLRGTSLPLWVPQHVDFFNHNEQFEQQPHPKFWVGWTPDVRNNKISFTVAVQTEGWVGWGPTASGGMIGGNPAVIREVTPGDSSTARCFAMHSEVFGTPIENEDQNCDLISYERNSNETLITFERPFFGCKPDDQDFKEYETMRMIGAWGTSQSFYQHTVYDRFSFELNALIGPIENPPLPPGTFTMNVTLPARQLPTYRDVYECNGHYMPNDRRYHMVGAETMMYDITPATYHHYLMFGCGDELPREYQDPDYYQDCPVIPHPSCIKFFNGWALGQKDLFLDKGIPVGDEGRDGAQVAFLFQSHIDNPTEERIEEPGWGVRLYLTATLTDIEMGAFGMYGGVPLGGAPAGVESFTTRSECSSRMMQSIFPQTIYLHSITPHAHGLSRKVSAHILRGRRWPRDGEWEEVGTSGTTHGPVLDTTHYDTNWQGFRFMLHPQNQGVGFEVQPGDRLRVTCTYNTMNRTQPVRNGEGFEDEMCIHYILYWPRGRDVSICAEFPPEVLPPYERMSGIGMSFADSPPFFWPVPRDPETIQELPVADNFCTKRG